MAIFFALALVSFLSPAQAELSLVYSDSLAPKPDRLLAGERFWYSQPAEWSFSNSVPDDGLGEPVPDSGPCLSVASTQSYQPRVRSPHSLAILSGVHLWLPHAFEVEVMQTGPETAHRDVVLVFGFESPEQFYYAHLGKIPDAVSSNVFEVDEAPRRRVGEIGTSAIEWGRGEWHRLRVECSGKGRVRVYVDDMEQPHFDVDLGQPVRGQIGFGSFDDSAAFRNLRVWEKSSWFLHMPPSLDKERADWFSWRMSPFGGIAKAEAAAPREAEQGTLHLKVNADRGGARAVFMDVDGDGVFNARVDRWVAAESPYSGRNQPEFMLALDEPAVTSDRIALQPVLDSDGNFPKPYRFQTGAPIQSYSDFLKTQYTRHSQGHPPVGPWRWGADSKTSGPSSRPTLLALTPSDDPMSWRWDAELFSDPAVAKRLQEDFTLVRLETGPRHMGPALVPLSAVQSRTGKGGGPSLHMTNAAGLPLGATSQLDSPEALLTWLQQTEVAEPADIRGPFHPVYR